MKLKLYSGWFNLLAQISIAACLIVALAFGATPAHAATVWTVTSTGDDGTGVAGNCPNVSNCRLRDAITAAADGDTIIFANSLSGQTIRLVSQLSINNKDLVIDGSALASKVTLSGDTDNDGTGNVSILFIQYSTVTIQSIHFTKGIASGGNYGAGIYLQNYTVLTLKNDYFSYNVSTSYGGGIYGTASSIITVINSTFSNNSSSSNGGAIVTDGTLNIKGSTFSNNSSNSYGGAVAGSPTISNSTFVNNYAERGGGVYGYNLTAKNNTFYGNIATWGAGNGGSVYISGGNISLANNIIAKSTGGDCGYYSSDTTFITNTNNLVMDGSCFASLSGDPKLGPLANNGGITQTMGLQAASPAIDAGNDSICAADPVNSLDQRGVTRPSGAHCDIGAYESRYSIATYQSLASQDGWVLESAENSNVGASINSTTTTLVLGDNNARKQYRAILAFNTSPLPDAAVIGGVLLKVRQQGVVGGVNPISLFQGFMADIKAGAFSTADLQTVDFQAAANASYGPFAVTPVSSWYTINLSSAKSYINKLTTSGGLTQIRLRFKVDDNNDTIANYLSLYSGNAGATLRPQLVIYYYIP